MMKCEEISQKLEDSLWKLSNMTIVTISSHFFPISSTITAIAGLWEGGGSDKEVESRGEEELWQSRKGARVEYQFLPDRNPGEEQASHPEFPWEFANDS